MQETIEKNLLQIREEIEPCKPNIIAVTKYFDENAIIAAYRAGLRHFAESRALEAIEKINKLPEEIKRNSTFHFIGHLQSNKVKKVVSYFDYIHSVDTFELAEKISQEALKADKIQKIFLEINNAEENQKFGFSKDNIFGIFGKIQKLSNIELAGLMNMTPLGAEEETSRKLFEELRQLESDLNSRFNCKMQELSMGMSQDYKIAAQSGATFLRIGRKLFN
ncbi:YggS family pyridoxal phosphate-dependent enzyme [bacterium]|nr:YggS family pyridoxal phosphate-dependent enzyme [bacterium]